MIAQAIRRRFGLHARRVRVQTEFAGYLRWIGLAFLGVGLGFIVWVICLQAGSWDISLESRSALERLRTEKAGLEKDNATLRSELAVLERELQIERASQAELARQVKAMAGENARLREDAALVQAVSAPDAKVDGVKVSSARVQANPVEGEYSYRIVLLQTGSRTKSFQGRYQLVVHLARDGDTRGITLPGPDDPAAQPYTLDFRVSQRLDGTFKVDPGAVVRSVQIRVFEGGQSQPKVMQTVTLS